MAEVELMIGGHHYSLTCADGEEAALLRLGGVVEQQVQAARGAIAGLNETRQLLFAALFLADQLETGSTASQSVVPAPSVDDPALAARILGQAQRIDALNTRLEDNLRVLASSLSA